MKRLGLFLVYFFVVSLVSFPAFSQIAKIVDIEGEVSTRKDENVSWQKAKPGMYLADEAEIKTGLDSECTITFDEELDNMMTIKGDSHIKMEDVKGGKVYLPQGRVFSIIDDLAKLQDFQVRTPTAIAGVKGTGEEIGVGECTTVKCFRGSAFAQTTDASQRKDIGSGFGIIVCLRAIGDIFDLDRSDWVDWEDFMKRIREIRWPGTDRDRRDRVNDFQIEGQEDLKENEFEKEYRGYRNEFTIESPSLSTK
jgi:hypothetical protein